MFKKDKATLSIQSIESASVKVVDLHISGPSASVLAAFQTILRGAATVQVACPESDEDLSPPATIKPPPSVRLLDPPYDGEPRTP